MHRGVKIQQVTIVLTAPLVKGGLSNEGVGACVCRGVKYAMMNKNKKTDEKNNRDVEDEQSVMGRCGKDKPKKKEGKKK